MTSDFLSIENPARANVRLIVPALDTRKNLRQREAYEKYNCAAATVPVGKIVSALGLSQPAVSKHLRVLKQAGLVDWSARDRAEQLRDNYVPSFG